MLKQRILTAVILAPLLIWAILALPAGYFSLLIGAVFLLAAWEWSALSGLSKPLARLSYLLLLLILMVLMSGVISKNTMLIALLLVVTVACWIAVLLWLYRQEKVGEKLHLATSTRLALGLIVLLMPYTGLVGLGIEFEQGRHLILFLMLLIWCADIAAYFVGRAFGKHKLAPHISPGKSWEGVFGALLFTLLLALVGSHVLGYGDSAYLYLTVLSMIVVVFSIAGDLFESMIKRQAGVKDSGQLLPGHGGMLDRIDSLTAAAPVFAAGMYLLRVMS